MAFGWVLLSEKPLYIQNGKYKLDSERDSLENIQRDFQRKKPRNALIPGSHHFKEGNKMSEME